VAMTLLAWATQTLRHRWGFGGEVAANSGNALDASQRRVESRGDDAQERFVPVSGVSRGATLELRSEASVVGTEIKLKQICRWTEADNAAVEPLAEMVIA